MIETIFVLACSWQVWAYFAALGWALNYCLRNAKQTWSIAFATLIVVVTWFYIGRYTVDYLAGGANNLFDDAYADVVEPASWGFSSQLLTWVVVAHVWTREASPHYLLFGMLGAMSAAFILWVPQQSKVFPSTRVPLIYVLTSMLSLCSIAMLPVTLGSPVPFGLWLKALHIFLLLPLLPWRGCAMTVEPCALYLVLAVAVAWFHYFAVPNDNYQWPSTDCNISITTDMVCCMGITLYAIFRHTGSVFVTAAAGLAAPFLSTGAVLALFLAWSHKQSAHVRLVTWLQAQVAKRLQTTGEVKFMNLGWWKGNTVVYNFACEKLASKLAQVMKSSASSEADTSILACGCGYGAELELFKRELNAVHITGIENNMDAVEAYQVTSDSRLLHIPVQEMRASLPLGMFNNILALDNVYHYPSKRAFLCDVAALLPCQGQIGVTDIVVKKPVPLWLKLVLGVCNVPAENLWSQTEYTAKLVECGFDKSSIQFEYLEDVLDRWLPTVALQFLGYAVIVARKVGEVAKKKLKIAVIGSGMSGLACAHSLSPYHDVTIYEARDKPGLSGAGVEIDGTVVDIPLRMIGLNYYSELTRLIRKLGVSTVAANTACTFYGDTNPETDGPSGGDVGVILEYSQWANAWWIVNHLRAVIKMVFKVVHVDLPSNEKETWREFLQRTGYLAKTTEEEDVVMWACMGQLSWVLSCTYEQVFNYPASVLLGFLKPLRGLQAMLLPATSKGIVRVAPSIDQLRLALAYGSKLVCNTPISDLGADRVINGIPYDVVVVATEALAVHKVLSAAPSVFSRVRYEPSSIVLHCDKSLMPQQRRDWRALNVCRTKDQAHSSLTVWLNRYYPEARFKNDYFQTWGPHKQPASCGTAKLVDKEADGDYQVHFNRVVHTKDTPAINREIADLQGRGDIFYAGSYAIHGMGLLEQAAKSGQLTAKLILEKYQ